MTSSLLFLALACPTELADSSESADGSNDSVPPDSGDTASGDSAETGGDDTATPEAPAWDPPAAQLTCNEGGDAPLYDAALADAEIARDDVGFTERLWDSYAGYVGGTFQLPWFEAVHHEPEHAACFVRQVAADLDAAPAAVHPLATAVRALKTEAGLTPGGEPVFSPATSLKDAVKLLKDVAGGGEDSDRTLELPDDLATALVPIVLALTEGISARHEMDAATDPFWKTRKLFADAPGIVLPGGGYMPDLNDTDDVTAFQDWYVSDAGPRRLLDPAAQLAFAVEDAHLEQFAGMDISWTFATDAGDIVISGSANDTHAPADSSVLFLLDLGGDDTYQDGAGANANADNPVALSVDLGGNDTYGYDAVGDSHDVGAMLPADADGRKNSSGYYISVSDVNRQGAGRYGIGLLMDLGSGKDAYASLRMSQGFGTLGVGILYDDGGDDAYSGESGVQGSAVYGYGLLFDAGGTDTYTTWAFSQGFGYVGSAGVLIDAAGDDVYWSDPGNSFGGTTLYYSPQLPGGEGNSSFSQGAGFGMRGDSYGLYFSGGVGILRDLSGNDAYTAGVFSEATGYWEGVGILSDGAGNDSYDALYYMQGGAAHFAAALFNDQGGNDEYNQSFDSYYMQTGAGHDFSLGLFIDDAGDDIYGYGGLAVGASNCEGVGVFVDRDGADTYLPRSTYSTGLGNHSGECETRTSQQSTGIFLDGGGDADTYVWFDGDVRTPMDDSVFGIEWAGTEDEHGGAADGMDESGF